MWERIHRNTQRIVQSARGMARTEAWTGLATRRTGSYLFILAGLVLLVYVSVQYGTMFHEQRKLARAWEQQEEQRAALTPGGSALAAHDNGLVRVAIPKIDFDAIVVDGTTGKKLLIGPGRLEDTPLPGEPGNSVITAHRDTFFRHIYQLRKGDEILVRRGGELFKFEVTGQKVVEPTDMSVLRQSKEPRLTLITCYPPYYIGPAPERLVVFSKLVDRIPDNARAAAGSAIPAAAPAPARAPAR